MTWSHRRAAAAAGPPPPPAWLSGSGWPLAADDATGWVPMVAAAAPRIPRLAAAAEVVCGSLWGSLQGADLLQRRRRRRAVVERCAQARERHPAREMAGLERERLLDCLARSGQVGGRGSGATQREP